MVGLGTATILSPVVAGGMQALSSAIGGGGKGNFRDSYGMYKLNKKYFEKTYDYQMPWAREQLRRSEDLQREFAKHSLGWRIADARKHGLSPLAAAGVSQSFPTMSPVSGSSADHSGQMDMRSGMGQDILGAVSKYLDPLQVKRQLIALEMDQAILEGQQLENDKARKEMLGDSDKVPGSGNTVIPGQHVKVDQEGTNVILEPRRVTKGEAGIVSGTPQAFEHKKVDRDTIKKLVTEETAEQASLDESPIDAIDLARHRLKSKFNNIKQLNHWIAGPWGHAKKELEVWLNDLRLVQKQLYKEHKEWYYFDAQNDEWKLHPYQGKGVVLIPKHHKRYGSGYKIWPGEPKKKYRKRRYSPSVFGSRMYGPGRHP